MSCLLADHPDSAPYTVVDVFGQGFTHQTKGSTMKPIHLHFNRSPHHPEAICKDAMRSDHFVFADKSDPADIREQLDVYGGEICSGCRRIAGIHTRRSSQFEKMIAVAWLNHFAAKDSGEVRSKRFARLSALESRVKMRAALRANQRQLRREFCDRNQPKPAACGHCTLAPADERGLREYLISRDCDVHNQIPY